MKKSVRPLLALATALVLGLGASANAMDLSFGNDGYAAQIGYDSFNQSIKKRMASARIGTATRMFGTAPVLAARDAYAAPSSRTATVGSSRRQLDCVYYSGFTVWADMYQTWARQRSRGAQDGFKYRTTGPAFGFDWSSGGWTVGVATTYSWGEVKGRDTANKRNTRQWALTGYGQYDAERFYANASIGFARNRFRSQRNYADPGTSFPRGARDRYSSHSWNVDGEFGLKFDFNCFRVAPNVGIRYFRDRRGTIDETGGNLTVHTDRKTYHVLEVPIGVDLSYEITTARAIIVPRARFAWIPELARKRGNVSGYYDVVDVDDGVLNRRNFSDNAARRSRHGFQAALGVEAKITNSFSAHLDYSLNIRSHAYEHHWNLGAGFTF